MRSVLLGSREIWIAPGSLGEGPGRPRPSSQAEKESEDQKAGVVAPFYPGLLPVVKSSLLTTQIRAGERARS